MFYVYGFAKSALTDIDEKDLKRFKEMAKENIGMTDEQLENRIKAGHWNEINWGDEREKEISERNFDDCTPGCRRSAPIGDN